MSIYAFDDFEDLFAQMRRDQAKADLCVEVWQAAITTGDYVARPGPGFMIYSEVLENPEPRRCSLKHYRFTTSYSIACPSGELGDIHVSTIERQLAEQEFQRLREQGWQE